MLVRLGFAALLTTAIVGLVPTPASAATSLGALWQLDETSGATALDSSGNANHGVLNGAPARISGRFGGALHMDGEDNVTIPRSPTFEPANVTTEAWVRESSTSGQYKYIMAVGANTCQVASYGLYTGADGGIQFYVSAGTGLEFAASPAAPPAAVWDGNWHHVAGTYDGSMVRLYLDGVEVGTGTPATLSIAYGLTNPDGLLGAFGGAECFLNYIGDIDAPRIWRRALTRDEVAASAAMASPAATRLDERVDSSQAIVYTSHFSSGQNMKVSIESASGTERISSIRLQGILPALLGRASCRDDLLGLLLSTCSIQLSNDGKTAALNVRRLSSSTRQVTLRVTVTSGRTFDVTVQT